MATKDLSLSVENIPPLELIPYVNNARTHSDEQINDIAASIREFGFLRPILIDDEMGVLAGHGRLKAALRLNMKSVPVIRVSHLSDVQKKAYILADNKLAENAGWDDTLLGLELEALQDSPLIELTGFSVDELDKLLSGSDDVDPMDNPDVGEFNPVIQYNIIFDHDGQQQKWFDLIKWLKDRYAGDTLGERLDAFIGDVLDGSV